MMDLLGSSTKSRPFIFSDIFLSTPKLSINAKSNKTSLGYLSPSSKILKKSSFPHYLAPSSTRKFQTFAHFGGPTSRRNSLRKKLFDDQKVHEDPIFLDPNSSCSYIKRFGEDLSGVSVEKSDIDDIVVVESSGVNESKTKPLGESVLLSKLENWVDQYKKDSEYWGIGSGPIFTVFQDLKGNVERVLVNEDEILKRSRVERQEIGDSIGVEYKIFYAKSLAREIEGGSNVIPRNSLVSKFVVSGGKSSFVNIFRSVNLQPDFLPKVSKVGRMVLFGFIAIWAFKKLFDIGKKEVEHTDVEKEMMRRKLKARREMEKEKEMSVKGSVEVVEESAEPAVMSFEKPKLDKQGLINSILKAKASKHKVALLDSSSFRASKSVDFDDKIQEIREMARQARQIESSENSLVDLDGEEKQAVKEELSSEMDEVKQCREEGVSFRSNLSNREPGQGIAGTIATLDEPKNDDTGFTNQIASVENGDMLAGTSILDESKDRQSTTKDSEDSESPSHLTDTREAMQSLFPSGTEPCTLNNIYARTNVKVIRSVKEAREYLSKKSHRQDPSQESHVKNPQESFTGLGQSSDKESGRNTSQLFDVENKEFRPALSGRDTEFTNMRNAGENSIPNDKDSVPIKKDVPEGSEEEYGISDSQKPPISSDQKGIGCSTETRPSLEMENWIGKNFHEVLPVLEKIGDGFRDNYLVAREKTSEKLSMNTELKQLGSVEDDSELEWMKDDRLSKIVFQVRENELEGRDPFYLMDAEDKLAFFQGLEKKVEKENEKLSHLHEWLHSNIENLDYGADGISLYDPPEKIIPRWKGPPLEKNPEFLNNYLEQRKAIFPGHGGISYPVIKNPQNSAGSPNHDNVSSSLGSNETKKKYKNSSNSKTVIESSDGSVKSGKKSGKEYWQHTKKWTRGFLESYNAETDPEVKSIMKNMGKDLDRWITENEIQEAAELMDKLPERNKVFMEKKLSKLKREMELFGPQAVVSKYCEYAEDKEEDYLWWLDLPHVLCIELYTIENGEQKIGFYSLEMAADIELEPKPYHVIAFEDAGDSKNFRYILQSHMDMLGNGHAFIVLQLPKDAFRQAKENGFGVTVIRKGELQLNVDKTLEEVEEQITEIGSKIYHDKIMQERSVDISSLMKGVFGASANPHRKRSKGMLKKPSKK
ncbi:hypothetical protein CFOL_v3_21365 [Cephalotus follicularis]|uniref:Uncharacterized protein n=1 Tax=Cephalotus follicularis TaxID=3775 RepID=A0A1Q3CCE5_CEPFO|nr:hypothetical protein CFOL_v3_21365 [Cephalotus follicularis]